MGAHGFLIDLALVLFVAAVTTVVFRKLHQPVVLGYLIAGAIVSPYTPIPLAADLETIHTLSELGVILLMFSLGLEFSVRSLIKVGPRAAFVAVIESSFMVWVGFAFGRSIGWTTMESLFLGGAVAISSTTIIVKAFQEYDVKGAIANLVLAILIVEDLIAILLLAVLTPIASGVSVSAGGLASTLFKLGLFLVAVLGVGYLTVPRATRFVLRLNRPETTLVACVGLCFAVSALAQVAGYSVALGAFLAGSLISESGEGKRIEHLVEPVRDVFAAIFFVSVGMLLDPRLIAENWIAVVALTLIVLTGKLIGVSTAAFLAGYGTKTSIRAGMSLAQIGEFSFIIVGVGLSLGATGPSLYPIAVAVSAATTLTTPWMIKLAPRVADFVDGHLPRAAQTFTTLYGAWVERLIKTPRAPTQGARIRRLVLLILVDGLCVAAIVFAGSSYLDEATAWLEENFSLSETIGHYVIIALGAIGAAPFFFGILRCARGIALLFGEHLFTPATNASGDRAARRTLIVIVQLGALLIVGAPLIAVTQPVLSTFRGAFVLVAALVLALIAFWRNAKTLDEEIRTGAQVIIDAVERSLPPAKGEPIVHQMMELGAMRAIRLEPSFFAIGKSLADLDLRAKTGAIVLALERDDAPAAIPSPREPFKEGDVIAVSGTPQALDAAEQMLRGAQPV